LSSVSDKSAASTEGGLRRPARKMTVLRASLGAVSFLAIALAALWKLSGPTPVSDQSTLKRVSQADSGALNSQLMNAIRGGEFSEVENLLEQGADANGRDDAGDTALMRAALYADVKTMQALVTHGASVRARGNDGNTPLLRSVHDLDKVRFLLERGALVDDLTMVAAARIPGSGELLDLLCAHGGSGRTGMQDYTALMAAAANGDLESVLCLLDHGADVKAWMPNGYTALIGAAASGNAKVVGLLLERGADPSAVCKLEGGILQTPAIVAATMGNADCLKLLMAAGADVNVQGGPFEMNALLGAATTASKETVQLLLATANLNATDWTGATALDWAARRGETDIVKLLREGGAKQRKPVSLTNTALAPQHPAGAEATRRAISAALPLLQQSERTITRTKNCVTCHQHSLVAMTVGLARGHGFDVDETIAREERYHVLKDMEARVRPLLLGTGIDSTLSAFALAGLAAEGEPASRTTDALVHYLVLRQRPEGHWQGESNRPPDDVSDFQFTALAVRGLQVYAPKARTREIALRIDRARRWLQSAQPRDTTDRVFQLLGLGWAQADPESVARAVLKLMSEQREDGGWAQLPTLASDAYATGLALCALHEGGGVATNHPCYQHGVEFLLRTQAADGSWYVSSRSFPIVEYSKSGFPHGRSQFISAAATCWATMALIETTDTRSSVAR
jgi:ankyrin repeat protein